eukprot:7683010-Pyramimonas_sp.AAC.1
MSSGRAAAEELETDPCLGLRDTNVDNGLGIRRHLLEQYKAGLMTATGVCVTAWHAQRGGC